VKSSPPELHSLSSFVAVQKYCALLREFPIHALLAATEWDVMARAVVEVFSHLKGIKRIEYPLSRAVDLIMGILFPLNSGF
jgi:sulfur transfer complex TusBCD TusB component (DsrH family)